MAKIKTFLSVHPSQRVTANIASVIEKMAARSNAYNWSKPAGLHVTVNFVGEIVDREVPEFCQTVKNFVQQFQPFELSLCGVKAFPSNEQPRTIYLAVDEGADALVYMNRELTKMIQDWGFNKDKNEFVPHVTLGRLRRGQRPDAAIEESLHRLRNHDSGFCNVGAIVVNSSYMDSSGPTYTPMATIKL
jgi:2'-5' RNA ligase